MRFVSALIVYCAFCPFHSAVSQTTLSLQMGVGRTSVRDEIVSPLTFGAGTMTGQLQYERQKPRSLQQLTLWYESARLLNRFGNGVSQMRGSLSYAYGRKVGNQPLFVGAEVEAYGAYRSFDLNTLPYAQPLTADLHTTLNVAVWYVGPPQPWGRFRATVSTPLVGLGYVRELYNSANYPVSLTPEIGSNAGILSRLLNTGTLVTSAQLINLYGRLAYDRPIGKRTCLVGSVAMRWYRYERLHNVTRLAQLYASVGLSVRL